MTISGDGKVIYNLDYRSKNDDAWYTSGVVLENGKRLRVKLEDFKSGDADEVFSMGNFSKHDELEEFLRRFRPVSVPVEENECSTVVEGMTVCATYKGDGSVRYFDAIVDGVCYKEHKPEKCVCTYLLCWKHGPGEGTVTAENIVDVCFIKSGAPDPRVTDFAKLVMEKLSSQSSLIPKTPFLSRKTSSNQTFNKLQEFSGDGDSCFSGFSEEKGRFKTELIDQDRDMGGVKETESHHFIILENLEKDLSPVLMKDFIYEQTSIPTHTYVFQSLSNEPYARGIIIVDSKQKLKRIHEFISNPNHFIVSTFSGRPWVIAEDMLRAETFNIMQILQPKSENKNTGNKLMVVHLGTKEYMRAKKSKDLYMEFRNHVNRLVKRLDMEEKKKWRSSSTN
ncbi:uncharacterized protein LOC111900487 [Lactuca sativa]|uniref:SAWADEE domain-containing protein n=1 Tax=Lactuca sativa TaxID=4236 RepID=A0A9R1UYJ1_LACSA|nr:uncharacterized protein LOC111900487 [Lactuca sativa]KAJ0195432.1 hypothetical protein LSAT_V11C700380470 [Lactuca sativa]